jgi:Uma2 family endonuclease
MGVEIQAHARAGRMSGEEFRQFQNRRPDRERWELIAGVPMMMVPPTIAHNHIAENLVRLLSDALADHDPSRLAAQRTGIELGSEDEYKPEPDVVVIDADYAAGQRFVERAYLLAEIVSASDEVRFTGMDKNWIDVKRDIYLTHAACEAVLIVEQDRMEVRVDVKTGMGWQSHHLGAGDELSLPAFGLRCPVVALYEGTPLRPRSRPQPPV